jgi:hypothetical protein
MKFLTVIDLFWNVLLLLFSKKIVILALSPKLKAPETCSVSNWI